MNTYFRKFLVISTYLFFCMSSLSVQSATIAEMVGAMKAGDYGTARSIALTFEKKNDPIALYTLGYLESQRNNIEGDKKAFNYFLKAASLGNLASMYFVHTGYLEGRGVKQDTKKAIEWMEKAISKGDVLSNFNLGYLYFDGTKVEKDIDKAFKHFLAVYETNTLKNSEEWVLSTFFIGLIFLPAKEQQLVTAVDQAFDAVLNTQTTSSRIEWAKSEILNFQTNKQWAPNRGDGTQADVLCRNRNLKTWTSEYSNCRIQVEADIKIKEQRALEFQRQNEIQAEIARRREAKFKEEQRDEALLRFLGALAGAGAPSRYSAPQPQGCFLNSSVVSGMYRNCIYRCVAGNVSRTVGAAELCPLSIQ
jgi:TPR repeat protein